VELSWIPLGAGEPLPLVRWSGRLFEATAARRRHRSPQDLYHSALVVTCRGARFAIEMGPAWRAGDGDRGVVGTGPVGLRVLGRSRWFRYEVRRWPEGRIPDLDAAVGEPVVLSRDEVRAARLLAAVPAFPTCTWGRDEQHAGEMWNSNSLVAWLLVRSGHDAGRVGLPVTGRAPGWDAGVTVARRSAAGPTRSPAR
jgi:hypothetical protein